MVKEWLKKKCSKCWDAALGMNQWKLFIEGPLMNCLKNLLISDRKQSRLVTGVLTSHCTLRWHLNIMSFLVSAICRKCGHEEVETYYLLWQCPSWLGTDYQKGHNKDGCGSRNMIKDVCKALTRSGAHSGHGRDLSAWCERLSTVTVLHGELMPRVGNHCLLPAVGRHL
jgi:hypothetical protein